MIRFLQINLNHCRAAQDLLLQEEKSRRIDISILSEPYSIPDDPTWCSSGNQKAAIHWNPGNLRDTGLLAKTGSYGHCAME